MKKLAALLTALALILGLCACSAAQTTWQEQYDLGTRYLSEGNYREAIIAFQAAIEIDPKQADAYIGLANAYLALGDLDSALQTLQDGYAATWDVRLQVRIDELTAPEVTPSPEPTPEPTPEVGHITWSLIDGTLTISGTGPMEDYVGSPWSEGETAPWYVENSQIITVIIETGVTSIGNSAFAYYSNLTSVSIPTSVTTIGEDAFYCCHNLTSIDLPDSVTKIGSRAFANTGLTSVTIPAGVTSIEENAFAVNGHLVSITAVENNPSFRGIDGVLFSKDLSTLVVYPAGKTNTAYTIPASVTEIAPSAFNNSQLTSLTIPRNVKTLGSGAFWMSHFTSVTMEGVVTIGEQAFGACYDLSHVTLPDTLTTIGRSAFYNTSLSSIAIPVSVTFIGSEAFGSYYSTVDEVYYAGTKEQWNQIVFEVTDYNYDTDEWIFENTNYENGGKEASCLYDATIHYNSSSR